MLRQRTNSSSGERNPKDLARCAPSLDRSGSCVRMHQLRFTLFGIRISSFPSPPPGPPD